MYAFVCVYMHIHMHIHVHIYIGTCLYVSLRDVSACIKALTTMTTYVSYTYRRNTTRAIRQLYTCCTLYKYILRCDV